MKKLIVLAAAATMAVCAQAATISWALTSKDTFKLQNGDSAKGIDVYILNTAGSDYSTLISGIADGSKKAADVSGSASFVATAKTGTSNAQAGKIGSTTSFNESTVTGAGKGETYSLAFLVFDSAGEDSYYYLSSTQSASGYGGSSEYIQANASKAQWTSSNAGGSWTKVVAGTTPDPDPGTDPIPEPTSGLLLLVGGAMLALRRKQK